MGTRLIALLAGVLAIALLVPGCGGGSDDDSSTAAGPSKAQFTKELDAACTRGNKRMEAALGDFLKEHRNIKKPSQADYVGIVKTVMVPSIRKEVKEIRALTVPSGDEDRVDGMVVALEEGLELAEDNPELVTSSSDVVFGEASRLAGEYGLKVCGSR
jgi:ABC-type glycerol-3-phosphate transport system substrate-binding protein